MKDTDGLAHTTWNCKYHIVFAPKYRRKVIYGKIRVDIGKIMRMLCARKGIEIIEAECCPDHIHMLVKIPPKYSIAEIVGHLKGKSALIYSHLIIPSYLQRVFLSRYPNMPQEIISPAKIVTAKYHMEPSK